MDGFYFVYFLKKKIVVVHTMGKVGSTAIEGSLGEAAGCLVYHTHFLTRKKLVEVDSVYRRSGNWRMPRHIAQSFSLSNHIGDIKEKGYVISMVREPIGRIISAYFQDIERLRSYLITDNGFDINRAIDELILILEEKDEYGGLWFQRELNDVFGINVYDYEFDHTRHCLYEKNQEIRLLVIRMEDLSFEDDLGQVVSDFIGIQEPISLLKLNVGKNKWYADAYSELRKKIVLDERFCKLASAIYDESPYFAHFYDEEERNELKKKWLVDSSKGLE